MRNVSSPAHGDLIGRHYGAAIIEHIDHDVLAERPPTPRRRWAAPVEVRLDPSRPVRWVAIAVALLVAGHVAAEALVGGLGAGRGSAVGDGIREQLDLNGEGNLPATASGVLLLGCGGLLALCGAVARRTGRPHARRWAVLGAIFALLALDEMLEWHEALIDPARAVVGGSGPLHFAWVVPYGIGVVVIAIAYRRFVLDLDPATRPPMLLAAVLYIGGALGLEMVGGAISGGADSTGASLAAVQAVEESLELAGLVVFAAALLRLLARGPGGTCLTLARDAGSGGEPAR
jgi:hypothetical protein